MSVPKDEQETLFRYDPASPVVSVFTAFPPARRKLERAGHRPYKVSRRRGVEEGWFYRVPLAEFHWRVGSARRARPLTDSQRVERAKRLREGRVRPRASASEIPHEQQGGNG